MLKLFLRGSAQFIVGDQPQMFCVRKVNHPYFQSIQERYKKNCRFGKNFYMISWQSNRNFVEDNYKEEI